jgi:hypothetical protein
MKTYNSFSVRRVGLLVKRDLVENWKKMFFSTLGLSFAFLLLMYVPYTTYDNTAIEGVMGGADEVYKGYCMIVFHSCSSAVGIYLMLLLAGFKGNMQTQGDRINVLMLPATNLEKFVARTLYLLLFVAVSSFLAIVVADILHMIVFPFFENASEDVLCRSLIPGLWEVKTHTQVLANTESARNIGVSYSVYMAGAFILSVLNCSLFVLGGCYWRKHHFIKTFALLMSAAIALVVVIGVNYSEAITVTDGAPVSAAQMVCDKLFWGLGYDSIFYLLMVVCSVWTVLNCWLAYRFFCRLQVVEPKRFNL